MPFAIHITWHTYGTWLPGDERGHVSNTLIPEGGFIRRHNTPGTPCAAGDNYTHNRAQQLLKQAPVYLTRPQALRAAESMVEAVVKRGWLILRAAVMANHTHVVIANCPNDGPAVQRILKGVSQAALSKLVSCNQCWWTAGGSDGYKHDDEAITNAVNYVRDQEYKLAVIVDNVASPFPPLPPG